jgi:predicted nucleic acid-binding protein
VTAGFLLDTNVISELVAAAQAPQVLGCLERQEPGRLFISVITLGELAYGVERLDGGRKRERLTRWLAEELTGQFSGRVLAFEREAALSWGAMRAAERQGRPRDLVDLQLAATAAAHDLTVATRNISDFEGLDIPLLDPWRTA